LESLMTTPESIVLIRRARDGDREAWDLLCKRYYPLWLRQYHGRLAAGLRGVLDTEDLVQSAMTQAVKECGKLAQDGAFFAWVSMIIRRKLYEKGRKGKRLRPGPIDDDLALGGPPGGSTSGAGAGAAGEPYERLLDAILSLFPVYPEPMGAVCMHYFEKAKVADMVAALAKSERSVHRLLEQGRSLLRAKLSLA